MPKKYDLYIGGKWFKPSSGSYSPVINPANSQILAQVAEGTKEDAKKAINTAREVFDKGEWSGKPPGERGKLLWKLADLFDSQLKFFAKLESLQTGKTIKYARDSDMPFISDNLRFFAGAGRILEGKAAADYTGGMGLSLIKREPIGVVTAIVPWNYPLYIAVWKIAPALAAGNTLVIKPASITPLTLLEFAKLVEKAGFPKGVFNVVTGPGGIVGSELASNSKVDMATLTGDTNTGKKIMQLASSNLKKVHLELGGKAPLIVLEDADLNAAAEGAVVGAFWNVGQDCTAVTRVYVPEKLEPNFTRMVVEKVKKFRIGNPQDENTDIGPLISAKQRERVENYIKIGQEEGANLIYGGFRPKGKQFEKGFYLTPAIFTNLQTSMKICQEEIFGPVLSIGTYKTLDEAIEKSNSVKYGLASSVWGKDINKCIKVASKLKFGTVWINEHGILVSEMPHGGFKQSGFGKDLSLYSLEEYTQIKHIYIDQTGLARKPWHYVVYGKP
ncbi:aldehyde dehydrogenase family protein [Candidatus Micrarchaeota archaeon]|nr:aldehyde dehydrogenase family protein [Candidatus Micrarchaeota archaeon]